MEALIFSYIQGPKITVNQPAFRLPKMNEK